MELIIIGFLGGLITGISPCILPILPVIFFSGGVDSARINAGEAAKETKRSNLRPYLVILGLIISFSIFTLLGNILINLLHLPVDFLRWAGIVVLILIGVGLLIPGFQHILEKPFSWIPQKQVSVKQNGFLLGLALGAVYVPCAGPVLAAVAVAGATGQVTLATVGLTLAFAIGAAIPLLFFALGGRKVAERVKAFRKHQKGIRMTGGILMILFAIALVFNLPQTLQRLVPDYTAGLQDKVQGQTDIQEKLNLGGLVNDQNKDLDKCTNGGQELESCGTAPEIKGIQEWFNTENNSPVTLDSLKGKVVMVDFWAYSCINCQRATPHIAKLYDTYKDYGFEAIGIHSPEYAFEKNVDNVKSGAKGLGINYPVAIDNNLSTWTNYRNRYWPAHYLVDKDGTVRNIKFGEGDYKTTEKLVRELIMQANPDAKLPAPVETTDDTGISERTSPETYLGVNKQVNFSGKEKYTNGSAAFNLPDTQPDDTFALEGQWNLAGQYIEPVSSDSSIHLNYNGAKVFIVVSGEGSLKIKENGEEKTVKISGTPTLYQIVDKDASSPGKLDIQIPQGVQAYSFTFG